MPKSHTSAGGAFDSSCAWPDAFSSQFEYVRYEEVEPMTHTDRVDLLAKHIAQIAFMRDLSHQKRFSLKYNLSIH